MRIVQLNLATDPRWPDADQLLDSYHTLTGWSEALRDARAAVHVVQRFSHDTVRRRNGITYELVADGAAGLPSPWQVFHRVLHAVCASRPDVIHINGLMFPGMLSATRREAGSAAVIVLQDHSGALPRRAPWPIVRWQGARWRRALRLADACTFTHRDLAAPWLARGLPPGLPVLEIPEASTALSARDRQVARRQTGVFGTPAILWVGRLDDNKDPMTMLRGVEGLLPDLPEARVWMVVPATASTRAVRRRIESSPILRERVHLIGEVPHPEMPAFYSSADIFISASHHEGSGYALIEAMACGLVPCVSDIPAHRALTGGCGTLWRPGDPASLTAALRQVATGPLEGEQARRRFVEALSWPVIGRQTMQAYSALVSRRRGGSL